jgi:hypothetical protein
VQFAFVDIDGVLILLFVVFGFFKKYLSSISLKTTLPMEGNFYTPLISIF